MEKNGSELRPGLRNVNAGQTHLCFLDEPNQRLYYRGYAIEDLAEHSTFEEVAYLLTYGALPDFSRNEFRENFTELINDLSGQDFQRILKTLRVQPRDSHPMDLLAMVVRSAGIRILNGVDFNSIGQENCRSLSGVLWIVTGFFAALISRWQTARTPLCLPKGYPTIAENILYQMVGRKPDEFETRLMDIALILYAEHEFNASTFAVRIAASAHTDIFSAIVGGIGVLRGSRHGGANEEAMKMMLEIEKPENVRTYLDRFFETPGVRLPGFGHAVYTRGDPRVAILKPYVRELSERKGDMRWYEITVALEEYMRDRAAQKGKGIPANVDLWTAPLYYLLDIPISMYTPLFAAARVAGWCAHYVEVRYENKEPIIRPRAEYVGPAPRPFVRSTDQK